MFSANSSQVSNGATYIEDVFSTYLYTANGGSNAINNGIDLAGKGGMVWAKARNLSGGTTVYGAGSNILYDTSRGVNSAISSNTTDGADTTSGHMSSFNSNGFTFAGNWEPNEYGYLYSSWTFRKQPKFFDVVTYTGDGASTRVISHNLGSTPGCIIVKSIDAVGDWLVYHRSMGVNKFGYLNGTNVWVTDSTTFKAVSSTTFTVGSYGDINGSGKTFVAYIFAHDAGGFGLTGTDNVISCGSYTGNGSATGPVVTLGYEPQWVMIKKSSASGTSWLMLDNMRGVPTGSADNYLLANTSDAESSADFIDFTSAGFQPSSTQTASNASGATYIYIAIRRGPMKTPTSGTSVYNAITRTGTGATATVSGVGFSGDLLINKPRVAGDPSWFDRLRGTGKGLRSNASDAEFSCTNVGAFTMDGFMVGPHSGTGSDANRSGYSEVYWDFRRNPNVFDEVCYTGTGSARTISHNLGVAPELMIVKDRSRVGTLWVTYAASQGNTKYADLSDPSGFATGTYWNNTSPTSSVFSVSALTDVNSSSDTYVAYLFATCPGVSKVGSYSGTGATQTIDCGFTGGARFVLIKRTDTTGGWFIWDTVRGMVSGTDPRLPIYTNSAETNANWVLTDSVGFQIVTTDATVNANGGTYIYLAIA